MKIEDLQKALAKIPNVGIVNKARRQAIIRQILALMEAGEGQ